MKPASTYDKNVDENPQKFKEDWDYILNGSEGNGVTRFWDILTRDWKASSSEEKTEFSVNIATAVIPVKLIKMPSSSVFSYITPKITKQLAKRGWTPEILHKLVNNPYTTRQAVNKATGNTATAYFNKNGAYVVKDNLTYEIIQISNRLDKNWIPDATIINPYRPK